MSARAKLKKKRSPLDFYETDPRVAEIMFHEARFQPLLTGRRVLDAGCGKGNLLSLFRDAPETEGIEIDPGRAAHTGQRFPKMVIHRDNFLTWECPWGFDFRYDLIISNPPYSIALAFVEKAIRLTKPIGVVMMLLPITFMSHRVRFHRRNPSDLYALDPRPSFTADGETDATEYGWFVWHKDSSRQWFPMPWRRIV